MRLQKTERHRTLWLSANDTNRWATRPGARWPCSFLGGRRLMAVFENEDLVDMAIDGGKGNQDCPADEFNACTSDFLEGRIK